MNMMTNEHCPIHCHKKLSWRAVFAGAVVAIGLTFLFNMLTLGIGLTAYTQSQEGALSLVFGSFAWIIIGSYLMLFISGWVAGKLASHEHCKPCSEGVVCGFIMWSLYLLISLFVLSHVTESSSTALFKSSLLNFSVENSKAAASSNSDAVHAVHTMGIATLATFFIFFVGALGSCIGAYCGMKKGKLCCEKKM